MFWSEFGAAPQIERSGMDGSERKVVVSSGVSWPGSLAVDMLEQRIYWTDEKLKCIGSATLDGENIKVWGNSFGVTVAYLTTELKCIGSRSFVND